MELKIFSLTLMLLALLTRWAMSEVIDADATDIDSDAGIELNVPAMNDTDLDAANLEPAMSVQFCSGKCKTGIDRCLVYCDHNMEATTWACNKITPCRKDNAECMKLANNDAVCH
ncbi:hypothetical protein ATEIFO6365_0002067900 [Aspergillus terreus]|uniref:Uncharacterized protein n=1 Tax=Aspergillus terreus TaxID=33178 RepID=A0A5M3YV26_ASPTE|nr:hypothetical protein ATETN484_0004067500 [Aspergillus terreus]GFF13568.1 hypothetical protein ATEIFO6365_0002067900 [Aspergillus terreus]